jgi:hypothetical protein
MTLRDYGGTPVLARSRPLVAFVVLVTAFLAACPGDGASRTLVPAGSGSAVSLDAAQGTVRPAGSRRTSGTAPCSTNGTNSFVGGQAANVAGGNNSFVGAGDSNLACQDGSGIVAGYNNVLSSTAATSFYLFIGAGESNSIASTQHGVTEDTAIFAGEGNSITSGTESIIAGGSYNTISAGGSTAIVAGSHNTIGLSASGAIIGAGTNNSVTATLGVIGAGEYNTVSGEGAYIAAGGYNTASGLGAVVDGGFNQTASGTFATIPGGYVNSAAGTYSFAAGARASAAQTGTFVWSDGSDGDAILTSSRAYQFLARASGGFTLYTNAASTVGAQLGPGSGTWASLSDRNAKTAIVPVDGEAVLAKVDALPITRWSYKTERGVRHVGPMAQDFYAAFGVGEDDRHITSIDEDGVTLAAIKALHAHNRALHVQNARLSSHERALRDANVRLRNRLSLLEASEREFRARAARRNAELQALQSEVTAFHAQ